MFADKGAIAARQDQGVGIAQAGHGVIQAGNGLIKAG